MKAHLGNQRYQEKPGFEQVQYNAKKGSLNFQNQQNTNHYESQRDTLHDELNVMLSKLEQEERGNSFNLELMDEYDRSTAIVASRGSALPKMGCHELMTSSSLFRFKDEIKQQLQEEFKPYATMQHASSQNNIEDFKEKIKLLIGGENNPQCRKSVETHRDNVLPANFSTCFKKQIPSKSRQVSIHTNAFLVTDIGDDTSQNKNDMYSTAQTLVNCSPTRKRKVKSNKQSFFSQTNNTFISQEGNNLPEQMRQSPTLHFEQDDIINVDKFQQILQQNQKQVEINKRLIQKRLLTFDQELKLRNNLKRKIKAFIDDPSQVPMRIFYNITTYDGKLFKKFLQLSRGMRKHFLFQLFEEIECISKNFVMRYGQVFQIESRYLQQTPISFCKEEGSRLDFVIKVNVKKEAKKLENRSVIIGYNYKLENQTNEYQSSYQFDLYKSQARRWLWLHKDECMFHGLADARAYTIPIVPICTGDSFELSITLQSLMGSLDFTALEWNHLQIESLPNQDDVRDYNRFKNLTPNRDLFQKYFADLKRVCEAEDTIIEWFLEPYVRDYSLRSHIKRRLDVRQFEDQFEILNVQVGGIDFSVWRVNLRALKNPKREYIFYDELNIGIRVLKEGSQSICNEVKRKGFLIDRGQDLELRAKDEIIVYVSMGGFEK